MRKRWGHPKLQGGDKGNGEREIVRGNVGTEIPKSKRKWGEKRDPLFVVHRNNDNEKGLSGGEKAHRADGGHQNEVGTNKRKTPPPKGEVFRRAGMGKEVVSARSEGI